MPEYYTDDFLTFNPGPSQVSPKIKQAVKDIAASNFLSISHRSSKFTEVSKKAIEGLRSKMGLPPEYHIFYMPSATGAINCLLKNVVEKRTFHFTHGTFSTLFYHSSLSEGFDALHHEPPWDKPIDWENVVIPEDVELISITHCETATGLIWPREELEKFRKRYPEPLLAIDATSTFGSMVMDWKVADVWICAVQKCLGLPSGLGLLIVGPRAFAKAMGIKRYASSWQNFESLEKMMKDYQTPETPNLMNIALLGVQMEDWDLRQNERDLVVKLELLDRTPWKYYVEDPNWRSPTVINYIVGKSEEWHRKAEEAGIILGLGYGPLKDSCIRIANFPAITPAHIKRLLSIF